MFLLCIISKCMHQPSSLSFYLSLFAHALSIYNSYLQTNHVTPPYLNNKGIGAVITTDLFTSSADSYFTFYASIHRYTTSTWLSFWASFWLLGHKLTYRPRIDISKQNQKRKKRKMIIVKLHHNLTFNLFNADIYISVTSVVLQKNKKDQKTITTVARILLV